MIFKAEKWIELPEIPVIESIFRDINDHPDEIALVSAENPSTIYTYRQLRDVVISVASGLKKNGLSKGDIVAFYAPNSTDYVIGMLACFSMGAIFTGINFNYKPIEVSHHLSDTQAKGIITTTKNIPIIEEVMGGQSHVQNLKTIITIDKEIPGSIFFGDLLKDDGSAYPKDQSFNVHEDVAAIYYSSGTTGLPKGVMLTHYNISTAIHLMRDPIYRPQIASDQQQVVLAFLPFFHIAGTISVISGLTVGEKIVAISGFKPETFLQAIQDHKVTQLIVVPPIVVFLAKTPLLCKYDVSSVRHVISAAAPLTEDVETEFYRRFNLDAIYQAYGMTELTGAGTIVPFGKPKPGSSGKMIHNTQAKVEDLGTRRDLSYGQEGEICIKGPYVMKGYLNKPDETQNTIDSEGWLHTGDVGFFDEDGYLFITGRIKELIKHKGFQVAPAELEGILITHPEVVDAAVIGVPDQSAGELPRAFIVKKPNSKVVEEEIFDFIKERLSRHKWLTGGVQFVPAIPKTASGKIIRADVKKLITDV